MLIEQYLFIPAVSTVLTVRALSESGFAKKTQRLSDYELDIFRHP